MQIVIELDEEEYIDFVDSGKPIFINRLCGALYHGIPLPKGHGRLIDADEVKKNHERWIGYIDEDMIARLNIAVDKHIPTIIPADKDCRDCKEWESCECGKKGHENGTSKGYSIGECTHFYRRR